MKIASSARHEVVIHNIPDRPEVDQGFVSCAWEGNCGPEPMPAAAQRLQSAFLTLKV